MSDAPTEILKNTKLTPLGEQLLQFYAQREGWSEDQIQKARLEFHIHKLKDQDFVNMRKAEGEERTELLKKWNNFEEHIPKCYTKPETESLTKDGETIELSDEQRKFVKKFRVDENGARNILAKEDEPSDNLPDKADYFLIKEAQKNNSKIKWDNIRQRYIPIEDWKRLHSKK